MKTGTKWLIGLGVFLILLVGTATTAGMWFVGTMNTLVQQDESVKASWSQVQNVYQRRSDLIPNLVETVKGYATHEHGTLQDVIAARASATQVKLDISTATPQQLQQYQAAQGQLSAALGRLMIVSEKYPELKANENFMDLQKQIEGTENRITVERKKFNETTQMYNAAIKIFPNSFVANIRGFVAKPYFEADQTANKAPQVKF